MENSPISHERSSESSDVSTQDWQGLQETVPFAGAESTATPTTEQADPKSEPRHQSLAEIFDDGESLPQLSEAERRTKADRDTLDASLRQFGSALYDKELTPDDKLKINTTLDVLDTASAMFDENESQTSAHDILGKLTARYDHLAQKAPTEDRKQKYFLMAHCASEQQRRFADWAGIDHEKNHPKAPAEQASTDFDNII